MAVHPPARSTHTPASATNRPLTPSSFPIATTSSSHATLNQQIDSLLLSIERNTHRLALEAAYDPSIPFHPGCKDCVRDYVRHVRGAQPLKVALEAAKEGERVKREWERLEVEGGLLRKMREGRREEVGRWEGLVRMGKEGEKKEGKGKESETPAGVAAAKDGGSDKATNTSDRHDASASSSASVPKASKSKPKPSVGRVAPTGGQGGASATSNIPAPRPPQAGAPTARGLPSLASSTNRLGQFSREDVEGAEQAFNELDEDQQMAILLNVPW